MEMTLTEIADARAGICRIEPENFEWIVARHQKQIYRVLFCMVRDQDIADTLTQECFLRAFQKRAAFRGESALSTWLMRIAINLARDHNRSRRWAFWRRLQHMDRLELNDSPDVRLSPEHTLLNRELLSVIECAVEKLPDRQRMIFLLRHVEEMPLDAIAEAMGLKLGTVKSHLFRAMATIRAACGGRI
ncbi:MAG: sigma-70 family RNA polymerase sigma factor [Acidobacteria bacterium]|nr:sigma-70 family RNA polymerase sigma factor [Acidobacteriota bacterium]